MPPVEPQGECRVMYVYDSKVAGPKGNLEKAWDLIQSDSLTTKGLKIEDPGQLGLFLGCKHEQYERALPGTSASEIFAAYYHNFRGNIYTCACASKG